MRTHPIATLAPLAIAALILGFVLHDTAPWTASREPRFRSSVTSNESLQSKIDRVQLAMQERLVRLDQQIAALRRDAKRLGDRRDPHLDAMTRRLDARVAAAHQSLLDLELATDETLDRMDAMAENTARDLEAEYARVRVALESVMEHAGL